MKKKIVLLLATACLCVGLTACGNPLKDLPEATGENIYDEDEESTGNDLADDIIDELMKSGGFLGGRIVSFVVNDRDDNEDSKERSELYIEVITESDTMEYVYYYIVDCKYSDERGWRVKGFELDEDEESTMTALTSVTKDDFLSIMEDVYAAYYGSTYVRFADGEFTDIAFADEKITSGIITGSYDDKYPRETMTVTFTWKNDYCSFTRDIDIECLFYSDAWNLNAYEFSEDYTTELTEEAREDLSDERMLADLAEKSIYTGGNDLHVTEDIIESYTFEDYEFSGDICYRDVEIVLKGTDIYTAHVTANYTYKYDGSNWDLSYVSADFHAVDQNIVGNYSGIVYDSTDDEAEAYATVYYSFIEVNDDGSVSGALKWVPAGEDAASIEAVNFTGTYYMDTPYIYISLDETIKTGTYSYFSYDYLYYNPETQRLYGKSYGRYYSISK